MVGQDLLINLGLFSKQCYRPCNIIATIIRHCEQKFVFGSNRPFRIGPIDKLIITKTKFFAENSLQTLPFLNTLVALHPESASPYFLDLVAKPLYIFNAHIWRPTDTLLVAVDCRAIYCNIA